MKSIINSFFAVFILGIIAMGFAFKPIKSIQILVQSTDSSISSADLSRSAEIISNRLKSFSTEKFEVSTIAGKNQILVILNEPRDMKLAENLITHKGTFGFYETFNYKEVSELLNGDSNLLTLFSDKAPDESTAQIGCTMAAGVARVNEYLNSYDLDRKCWFTWSNLFEDSEVCLYALKLNNGEGAIISGAGIESFGSGHDSAWKQDYISLRFKKPVIQLWAEITKRNSGKALAIVLDGKVIFAPVVQGEIPGGSCTLTGGFTAAQVKYIAAIGSNGELPVSFKVVN